MSKIKKVTTDTFTPMVIEKDGPVLVDFWAAWCGPCRALSPILETLDVDVVKLNVDEEPEVAQNYGIVSIPTMIMFVDGLEVKRITGARPRGYLVEQFSEYM